jgi:hypothetical protein
MVGVANLAAAEPVAGARSEAGSGRKLTAHLYSSAGLMAFGREGVEVAELLRRSCV